MALIDDFLPALAFAALLASDESLEATPYETARADMDRLLAQAMAGSEPENPRLAADALFPVCAFADEVVLASNWEGRHQWVRHKLQQQHFNTANAGEEFYQRLEVLQAQSRWAEDEPAVAAAGETSPADEGQRQLLELYIACLTLGFSGRYHDQQGRDQIAELTRSNLSRLQKEPTQSGRLFPEAYQTALPDFGKPRLSPLLRLLLFATPPTLLAVGVYLSYDALLSANVTNWLQALR